MSGNINSGIRICKGKHEIKFATTVHTPKGVLYVAVLKQRQMDDQRLEAKKKMAAKLLNDSEGKMIECAMAAKPITINKAHCMCRHMGQQYSQEITKRGFHQCQHCGKAKAKQLPVAVDNQNHIVAGAEGHRVFIDMSSVKHGSEKKKLLSKPYWMMIVVELTNYKISKFLAKKRKVNCQ
jgi:hypothetical protein